MKKLKIFAVFTAVAFVFGLFSCSSPISGGSSLNGNRQVNLTFICGEEESKVNVGKSYIENYITYLQQVLLL